MNQAYYISEDQHHAFERVISYFERYGMEHFDQSLPRIVEENGLVGSFAAHLSRCFDARDTNPHLVYVYGEKGQGLPKNYSGDAWEKDGGDLIFKVFGLSIKVLHSCGAGNEATVQSIFHAPWREHPAHVFRDARRLCVVQGNPDLKPTPVKKRFLVADSEEKLAKGEGEVVRARSIQKAALRALGLEEDKAYLYNAVWDDLYIRDLETSEVRKVYVDIDTRFKFYVDPISS